MGDHTMRVMLDPGCLSSILSSLAPDPCDMDDADSPPSPLPVLLLVGDGDAASSRRGERRRQKRRPTIAAIAIAALCAAGTGAAPGGPRLTSEPSRPTQGSPEMPVVLYDNGPLVNCAGCGAGGEDLSLVQTTLGLISYGFGHQASSVNRVAEDFVVPAPGWHVDTVTFFAYQTGAGTTSTITDVNLQIWDGVPGDPGTGVVWGDTTTNIMASTTWTGIYRVRDDTPPGDTQRAVMESVVTVNVDLPAGTYWLDWQSGGSLASGPWAPPITINGATTTGNARQYLGAWSDALDGGTFTPQGLPFIIAGHPLGSGALWDQPLSTVNTVGYGNQDFETAMDAYDIAIADDFVTGPYEWAIDTIFVPTDWGGTCALDQASNLSFSIYADAGGVPAGDPWGGGAPPEWAMWLSPADPQITLTPGSGGLLTDVTLSLVIPVVLPPGHYWLVFVPAIDFTATGCQSGRQPAGTTNLSEAVVINPLGGFGHPTAWTPVTDASAWGGGGLTQTDFAFRLDGTAFQIGMSVAIAASDYGNTLEHDHLADTLLTLGYAPVTVTSISDAALAGARALIVYPGGWAGAGLDVPDLQWWLECGRGLVQIGDWHDVIPNGYETLAPGTPVTITVHNAWHPVVHGLAPSWAGYGLLRYGFTTEDYLGYTHGALGELDLANGTVSGYSPHDYAIAALAEAPPRHGRTVYLGINVYGPDAGPNEHALLDNALAWVIEQQTIFADGFESGGLSAWSSTAP